MSYKFLLHQKKSSLPYYLKFTYTDIFPRFTVTTPPPADYSQSRIIFKQIDIYHSVENFSESFLWKVVGNCGEFHTFTVAYYNKVMIRFLGNIEARADAKGRVFIPATFRKQLQAASEERLIMRKDVFQDCLTLYPESVWNEELNELRSRLNKWNSKHQLIFRQFVSDVEIVTPDSNGRILIPKRYLQICSIHGDIRFIGIDNKIEIWAKERAEQPFMSPEEFGAALEEIMNDDNRQDGER